MNRTELEAITRKYGLEQPRSVGTQRLLGNPFSGDWGCSWAHD